MKSFAPHFNLSLLNISLKSGIWAGITAVSFASGAVTVANNWSFLKQQAQDFYETTIKVYVVDPLLSNNGFFREYIISGFEGIISDITSFYNYVYTDDLSESLESSLSLKYLLASYHPLFSESMEYLTSIFGTIKKFLSSDFLTVQNIRISMVWFVNITRLLGEMIEMMIKGETFKIEELSKSSFELLQSENLSQIIKNFIYVLKENPDILKFLTVDDIIEALKNSVKNFDAFQEGVEELKKNPITNMEGNEKKEEIMKRLFRIKCHPSTRGGILGSLTCLFQENVKDLFNHEGWSETLKCKEDGNCSKSAWEVPKIFFNGGVETIGKLAEYFKENWRSSENDS